MKVLTNQITSVFLTRHYYKKSFNRLQFIKNLVFFVSFLFYSSFGLGANPVTPSIATVTNTQSVKPNYPFFLADSKRWQKVLYFSNHA